MLDVPIDPVLRIRGAPQRVLQRTSDAVKFLKQMMLARPDGPWTTLLQALQDAQDEWSAMEAVVQLEITLEAEGRLVEEKQPSGAQSIPLARSA
jgi:hypothetical protein